MTKPIYRHLANQKWRSYERTLLLQRITQLHVVPDILPTIDPVVSTKLTFCNPSNPRKLRNVQHGEIVDSRISEHPPILSIQSYEKGEKLITIAIVNPDVPNVEKDGFDYRCHFLACNITISPTQTTVDLGKLSEDQIVLPYLPAYAQDGLPYQRMAVFVMEQAHKSTSSAVGEDGISFEHEKLSISQIKGARDGAFSRRENFFLRSLRKEFGLKAIGVDIFRTEWDEGTQGVMERAGIVGADLVFKRKRIEPLPYKRLKEERYR